MAHQQVAANEQQQGMQWRFELTKVDFVRPPAQAKQCPRHKQQGCNDDRFVQQLFADPWTQAQRNQSGNAEQTVVKLVMHIAPRQEKQRTKQ
ncbi:hypothetical protein D9M71_785080 [compost metagenome]